MTSEAERTPTPRATPTIVRSVRRRRAQSLRQASDVEAAPLEAELGEPGDERGGRVVGSAAEVDLVADPPVTDDKDPVGVGRGPRVVGHEDDRLAPLSHERQSASRISPPVV